MKCKSCGADVDKGRVCKYCGTIAWERLAFDADWLDSSGTMVLEVGSDAAIDKILDYAEPYRDEEGRIVRGTPKMLIKIKGVKAYYVSERIGSVVNSHDICKRSNERHRTNERSGR